ncbi:methyltransferase domain-containing protein [Nocardioides sp. SYSU D00038]|uniref:class I SAM-dependent methyltransferase n=1 Tax=Nocardioides sp. SYSU D00038 TaxID=2812554 RepID=UPI0019681A4C|nr:methyltransferase domain-containing protein [Nocardioides sp. SYSU D00038]
MHPRLQALRGDPRVHKVVSTVNTPLAKWRGARAFERAKRPINLEIGGTGKRPGWLTTNVNPRARYWMDATAPWPFEDAACQHIFADNMIEHVPLEAGRHVFREAFRTLQPGGVLRLVTPDIRKHVDLYLQGQAAVKSDLADVYRSIGIPVEHPLDLLRITIGFFGHNDGYIFDFETIKAELEAVGFTKVTYCGMGESDHPALRGLDSRMNEGSGQMSVEATKP